MITLGIETSCDETGILPYMIVKRSFSESASQPNKAHAKFGGVVPELASRDHIKRLLPLLKLALSEANLTLEKIKT